MRYKLTLYLCAIFALLISNTTQAQNNASEDVSSELEIFRVDKTDDEETLIAVDEINAGDTVEYQLTYVNNMGEAITNLKPELPIPQGMTLVPNTAAPEISGASLQAQGVIQSLPIRTEFELPNGETVVKSATPEQYKRIQWLVSQLNEGDSVLVSVRMAVNNPN